MTYDIEYLFIATWCDFNEQFVQIFAHFSIEFLGFLLRVLCIFWEMVFYQICLGNIISVACPILLTVYFREQKFFILVMSSLLFFLWIMPLVF